MKNKTDYDIIIAGGGPAGLAAALYCGRAKLNTLLLEPGAPGGQMVLTDLIENYPGFPDGVTGAEISQKMEDQARKWDIKFETQEVTKIYADGDIKSVETSKGTYTAGAVIVATGAEPRRLGVQGEKDLWGKGVSYCAVCDGPFFKNASLAVIGGGDSAIEEAHYLTKYASKIYIIHRRNELRASKVLQDRLFESNKVEAVWDSVVTGINGDNKVSGVSVKNVKTDQQSQIEVGGVFVFIGMLPNTDIFRDEIQKDGDNYIVVDINMETSIKGVFAVGDARSLSVRQIASASGDGVTAAICAERYFNTLP